MRFVESATPTRLAYGKFISSKSEQPRICQHKWSNEINLPPDEKIDWRAVYQLAFQCTKSSKLITFNCKLLHRRLATNTFLKKIRVLEDDKCTFCQSEAESLFFFFWKCEITQDSWISVFSWLKSCQIINIYPQVHTTLGLRPDQSKNKLQIIFVFCSPSITTGYAYIKRTVQN